MLGLGDSAPRKGADAMTFVGCDLHTRMQQVAVPRQELKHRPARPAPSENGCYVVYAREIWLLPLLAEVEGVVVPEPEPPA
jgi:hypothetical protein